MDKEQLKQMIYDYLIVILQMNAPKDTGNLSLNSIRQMEGGVGIGGEIAPYATATEEQNRSSKGWIKRTIQSALPVLEQLVINNISKEEMLKIIEETQDDVTGQFNELAKRYE